MLNYTFARIASGSSLSGAIEIGNAVVAGIQMPSGWDAAALSFQGSMDGSTYYDMYDNTGAERSISVAASRVITFDPTMFLGVKFIKVRSGLTAAAVNQTADRSIVLGLV